MDISSYLAVGGWFIQVIFDKYLSYKLRSWAANCGIDHELDRLRVALLRTQSVTHGTELAPTLSHSSLPWMRELRDVMYHAEDLLDKLEYNRLNHEMEESRANESSRSPISAFMHSRFRDQGAPSFYPGAMLGYINQGGIGKTALAQHVYNDTRITENFNVKMWISVTYLFDELITKEMLESASSSRFRHDGTTNLNRLQVALKARLASKQFLLVLDDVWNNDNWIAQGFVNPDGCRRMEDIGKECINDLCDKSFFTIQKKEFVSYYLMPPVIYELAKSVATEECFRMGDDEWTRIPSSVCHLSVHLDSLSALDDTIPYKNLRTLIFLTSRTVAPINASIPQVVLNNIRSLRVLDLSPCMMDRLPDSIRQCVHLWYLNISSTTITTPPEFLCKLYHLQVLNLSGCKLGKLPSRMNNLVNLRHLTAANQIVSSITDIGRSETLRISILLMRQRKPCCVRKANYLCKVNTNREEGELEALQPHENLKRLDIMGWMGVKSSSWLKSEWLSNLQHIFLSGCNAWEQLPPLGQLPSIRTIWLQHLKMLRQIGSEAYGSGSQQEPFQSLEELVLDDMPEFNEWLWSGHTMRNLHNVVIKDCNKLKALPPVPPNLTEVTTARKGYWMPYHHDAKLAHATTARSSVSSLCIFNCPLLLARLSSPMTNEIIASFGLLRSLITDQMTILGCPLLRERLKFIESLDIQDCSETTSFSADDSDVLLQLKSLQSLCISGCNTLRSLPSTLSRIQSLYKLVLWNCPALESLPEEPLPLSIRKIEVALCHPLLKERLIKEYGVDWPKTAHIPWIEIYGEILQQKLQIGK
ncbi:hypothetical protein BAE44_0017685 [Dichanthelium oligosanthes]|uniref:Disease resistance RPP13-like protein 1 n=1 Tax=Dichanthelium oligosanthes TaxID=888268 RepID=A0A1E5V853_9POAL|nr:hypothetical protein BAE44_0017685 [Dichanthelium oligosanthes]